jgi:intracellular septation protein
MPFEKVIEPPKAKLNPTLKFALELGPVVLFFVVYRLFGVFPATATMMVTATVSVLISYQLLKRWPIMPVVTAVMVLIFGSLTLWRQDQTFLQIKLTVIYLMFGSALAYGLVFRKPLLKIMFDEAFTISEQGWRVLTILWMFFFFALAGVNEIVRNYASYDNWVNFKTFGVTPATVLFALAQAPLIAKFMTKETEPSSDF